MESLVNGCNLRRVDTWDATAAIHAAPAALRLSALAQSLSLFLSVVR